MWKDDAINENIGSIINILNEDIQEECKTIIFIGFVDDGVVGINASFRTVNGEKKYPKNFFSYDEKLEAEFLEFHKKFKNAGEDWKAVKVVCDDEGEFDIEFEYNDPYKWDS